MGFRHTIYEPPQRFCEELFHGPYARFVHLHEFEERSAGTTLVRDSLDVSLPWQYGSEAALRLLVAPMLRRTFAFRQRALRRLVAAGAVRKHAAASR
jgi:ligand-binding SRPBCC domain-containing protein